MSDKNTWNFPCWQLKDHGPDYARCEHGVLFRLQPNVGVPQPFTQTITVLFSFLLRSGGWGDDTGQINGIMSATRYGAWSRSFSLYVKEVAGDLKLYVFGSDNAATSLGTIAYRLRLELGDEDGVNWLQRDKWYQCGLSLSGSNNSWAMNGSVSPTQVVTTDAPGALNLSYGNDRVWVGNSKSSATVPDPIFLSEEWSTLTVGPLMAFTTAMDFSDATVRNRIWDTDGNFRYPGADGSLWMGDVYGDIRPEIYLLNGTAVRDVGFYNAGWLGNSGGASGQSCAPGGMRKQYETITV